MRSKAFPAIAAVLALGTACGGGLDSASVEKEFTEAYPKSRVGTHSLLDGECAGWNNRYSVKSVAKDKDGAVCLAGSRLEYTSGLAATKGAEAPIGKTECRAPQEVSWPRDNRGAIELGQYYCLAGAGHVTAIRAERQTDDSVLISYVTISTWELGG